VLDTVASISRSRNLQTGADVTLATGLAASIGAATTGWTDWSDTYGQDRKVGLLHGLTMGTVVVTYTAALIARLLGARRAGVMLANTGLALVTVGAYLGGDEVYDLGYSVNRTAYNSGPSDFVPVLSESELEADTPTKVDAEGRSVLLVKQSGQVFALDDTCVHAGCSLSGGQIEGRSIICPCHGSQYELDSGSVINGPATRPEPTLAVRLRNGMIEVKGE
jgi:nitrite reductase/ring-hydroxylating ferredoxin subunit